MTTTLVPCLKPYLRPTFTETWAKLCQVYGEGARARDIIRSKADWGNFSRSEEEGLEIERRLYRKAKARTDIAPIMAPGRK